MIATGLDATHATRRLAAFAAGLAYDDIPPAVVERAKLLLLDGLGCGLYGTTLPWRPELAAMLAKLDTTQTGIVWGSTQRLGPPHAAVINGAQLQGYELDDVHRFGIVHLAAVTFPALFALADLGMPVDGRTLIASIVAAYEVAPRVGICVGDQAHTAQGWHAGSTIGVFAAAAGSSRFLGLDAAQTGVAFGIAASSASGLKAAPYAGMLRGMHAGFAAQRGLYAALLAQSGCDGIDDVFERPDGFCATFAGPGGTFDALALTAGLGTAWETMRVSLKFYASAFTTHTTMEAIERIRAHRPFAAGDVTRVIVRAVPVTVKRNGAPYEIVDAVNAQQNIRFCVAALVLDGDITMETFSDAGIADPRRAAFARNVDVVAEDPNDPVLRALGREARQHVRVEVHLANGDVLHETVVAPKGTESRFASAGEVETKFAGLAGGVIGSARAERVRDTVRRLEDVRDVREVAALLSPLS